MRFSVIAVLLVMFGCATTVPPRAPLFRADLQPETRALPQNPASETLPTASDGGEFGGKEGEVEALEEGQPAPFAGLLFSEKESVRLNLFKIRYKELRALSEADRVEWVIQRQTYERALDLDHKKITELQPTWLDEHMLEVGIGVGLIAGAAVTISAAKIVQATMLP